jgi:Putative zinc-finger
MTQHCNKYTEKFISRYVDNELDTVKRIEFLSHLGTCPDCTDKVSTFQKLGIVFNSHATQIAISSLNTAELSLDPKKTDGARFFGRATDHLYIKLASVTAVALILILIVFQTSPRQISPSAIVKSLDTNASSVMIIETLKEKHTILWFSET